MLLSWIYTAYGDELKLPSGLKTIERQAFYQDAGLDIVVLPEGLERIESEAFAQSGIRKIHLPKSLKFIADNAFQGCENLTVTADRVSYAYSWAVQNGWISDLTASVVSVPDTLEAGRNLTVSVEGPLNSVRHTIFLLGDQTKFAETRVLTKQSGSVTWKGYRLEPDTYRVIVYTVTDEYLTLTPVVKYVQIDGERAEGPALSLPESVEYEKEFRLDVENESVVKVVWYDLDGNQIEQNEGWETASEEFIWIWNGYEALQNGGYIDISAAEYKNEKWTAWGPVGRVTVTPMPSILQLDVPVFTVSGTASAGKDLEFSFTEVEHATVYAMYLDRIGETEGNQFRHEAIFAETVTIPGHYLSEGEYTLTLYARPEDGYKKSSIQKTITVSGQRPPAPEISIDKSEVLFESNERATLSIHADGAENAVICCSAANYSDIAEYVQLDDNGSGTYSIYSYWYSEPACVQLSVSVLIGDTWSEWSTPIEIQFKKMEPLSAPVLSAPTAINNGEDFTFSFAPVEHADYYEARVKPVYGSDSIKSWNSQNCTPGTPLTLEGYNLSRGSYYVTVTAYSSEYSPSTAECRFTVTGTKPAAPEIVCDKEEIHINEKVQFTLCEDSAEAFVVKYAGRTNATSWGSTVNVSSASGNVFAWNWTAPSAATGAAFTFTFACKQNGLWSGWKTLTYEIQDRPQLAAPRDSRPGNVSGGGKRDVLL